MYRILKIGMDVHSINYTLCAMEPTIGAEDRIYGEVQVAPDYKAVICFIESLKLKLGLSNRYSIECGYEAGMPRLYPLSSTHRRRDQMCHIYTDNHAHPTGATGQNG